MDFEQETDWRQYEEYMTIRTVKDAVHKLQALKAEFHEKGLQEMAVERRDELRQRFQLRAKSMRANL